MRSDYMKQKKLLRLGLVTCLTRCQIKSAEIIFLINEKYTFIITCTKYNEDNYSNQKNVAANKKVAEPFSLYSSIHVYRWMGKQVNEWKGEEKNGCTGDSIIRLFVSEGQSRFLTFGPLTFFPIQINKNYQMELMLDRCPRALSRLYHGHLP